MINLKVCTNVLFAILSPSWGRRGGEGMGHRGKISL